MDIDDYCKNEKFKKLKSSPSKISISYVEYYSDWLIEKYVIGQKRLEKIYGPYALGIERELTDNELSESSLFNYICENYNENEKRNENSNELLHYFYRNKNEENCSGKYGLIRRLKEWGIDVDKFNNKRERLKLFYFLYCFEHENNMKLMPFLGNPTLENVDNSIVNNDTKNGKLMLQLKKNISKEISSEFISEARQLIITIVQKSEDLINNLFTMINSSYINHTKLSELQRIDKYLDEFIYRYNINSKEVGAEQHSLLETFYLRLLQHENIGRQNDIIDVTKQLINQIKPYSIDKLEIYREKARNRIKKSEINKYIDNNRKELAQFVFEKNSIDSNEFKKFDIAKSKVEYCIDMLNKNTEEGYKDSISELIIIACIQEIIQLDKNEKVPNKFYSYKTSDQKTISSELANGKNAYIKNQIAWDLKVFNRFYILLQCSDEILLVRKIEAKYDQILLKILNCNSLDDMTHLACYFLYNINLILSNSIKANNNRELLRRLLINGYTIEGNDFILHMFLGIDVGALFEFANAFNEAIASDEEKDIFDGDFEFSKNGKELEHFKISVVINRLDKVIELLKFTVISYPYNSDSFLIDYTKNAT